MGKLHCFTAAGGVRLCFWQISGLDWDGVTGDQCRLVGREEFPSLGKRRRGLGGPSSWWLSEFPPVPHRLTFHWLPVQHRVDEGVTISRIEMRT